MGEGWWAVLVTEGTGGLVGLLFTLTKEWFQRKERVKPVLLDRRMRFYIWADEGKGGLKPVSSRSSAHVMLIDLDVRWTNVSTVPVTLDQLHLVLRTGTITRRIPCFDRDRREPFSLCRIPARDTSSTRLSVRIDRWPVEQAVFFVSQEVILRLKGRTTRDREWTLGVGSLTEV